MTDRKNLIRIFIFFGVMLCTIPAAAQIDTSVENRVRALENYVDTFQPTLIDFSSGFEKSISQYTDQLEANLQEFSRNLEDKIDKRLERIDSRKAYIDIRSRSYQQVSTSSGKFIISVKKIKPITDGVRVTIDIGNPNFADYKDFKLKLFWGKASQAITQEEYTQWRESLVGADFTFEGRLEKGTWNEVQVDLVPTSTATFEHLELQMEVSSIELQSKNY